MSDPKQWSGKWAYTGVYPAEMVEDEPRLAATIENETIAARQLAVEQGYTLLDGPVITAEPGVMLDNWRDEGPKMVGLDFARRYADYEGEATFYIYRYDWDATRP